MSGHRISHVLMALAKTSTLPTQLPKRSGYGVCAFADLTLMDLGNRVLPLRNLSEPFYDS
jgi:hypothetical protein